jgi:4a-hydroxytetrahydrobiopterin dehydratase
MTKLPYPRVAEGLPPGWALLLDRIATRVPTRDFATGLALVDQIGAAAEAADHHPHLDLRYTAVEVRLSSHDEGGVTERDLALARTISDLAVSAGLTPSAVGVTQLELGLDSPDRAAVAPFWAAVLGATAHDIEDPEGNKICLCTWQDRRVS